jgi:hypothetical protein
MLLSMDRQCTVCGARRFSHSVGDALCPGLNGWTSNVFNNYKVVLAQTPVSGTLVEWMDDLFKIYSSTVVGGKHPHGYDSVLFGWKSEDDAPSCAWDSKLSTLEPVLLQLQLTYGYWVRPSDRVWIITSDALTHGSRGQSTSTNHISCTGCGNFNNYAVPNQTDGTFKCYSCRQRG